MRHDQEPFRFGHPNNDEPLFLDGMVGVATAFEEM
jgi:hypothetical protein